MKALFLQTNHAGERGLAQVTSGLTEQAAADLRAALIREAGDYKNPMIRREWIIGDDAIGIPAVDPLRGGTEKAYSKAVVNQFIAECELLSDTPAFS